MIYNILLPFQKRMCCIETFDPTIMKFIEVYYGFYCHEICDNSFFVSVCRKDDGYILKTCEGVCHTYTPIRYIMDLIWRAGGVRDDFLLLHGMAVEIKGKANLFLSHTNHGKSTLAALLTCQNYKILTDDIVAINKNSGLLTPVCLPICLRAGGKDFISKVFDISSSFVEIDVYNEKRYLLSFLAAMDEYEINSIIFAKYGKENCHHIVDSCNIRMAAIYESLMEVDVFDLPTLVSIKELAKIDTYSLEYISDKYVLNFLSDCI